MGIEAGEFRKTIDAPKLWADLTDEEKGARLLAEYVGDGSELDPIIPMTLDWSALKPEWQWAAVDSDGCVYVYKEKPSIEMSVGWGDGGNTRCVDHLASLDRGTVVWRYSLIERPVELVNTRSKE